MSEWAKLQRELNTTGIKRRARTLRVWKGLANQRRIVGELRVKLGKAELELGKLEGEWFALLEQANGVSK